MMFDLEKDFRPKFGKLLWVEVIVQVLRVYLDRESSLGSAQLEEDDWKIARAVAFYCAISIEFV